jgi:hypothetical protein
MSAHTAAPPGWCQSRADVARLHQRRVDTQRKHVVIAVYESVEISRDFQIEAGIKPEHQAGDNGNGERGQQSGAVHAGSSSRHARK